MSELTILENGNVLVRVDVELRSHCGRKRVHAELLDVPDDPILQNVVRAFRWRDLIDSGKFRSANELACTVNLDYSYVNRIIRLTNLCPDIIHMILTRTLPDNVTLDLLRKVADSSWQDQKIRLGVA